MAIFVIPKITNRKEEMPMARKREPQSPPQEDTRIQEFLDMIAPSVIKFQTDHFICGNTYSCVWALREYAT
ncbi:hypothetical protein OBV_44770 [Oscillibacter valericigenes Sjm18-20]|nr:hypothetical protein OBV_44770 [Oscillibacter valericigenes Sjm18-20]